MLAPRLMYCFVALICVPKQIGGIYDNRPNTEVYWIISGFVYPIFFVWMITCIFVFRPKKSSAACASSMVGLLLTYLVGINAHIRRSNTETTARLGLL